MHMTKCLYIIKRSTHHANVAVNVEDALVGALFIQFGQHQLLHTKHYSIFATDADSCAAETRETSR